MYINEKSWEVHQEKNIRIEQALLQFIELYSVMCQEYGAMALFVPENMDLNLYSREFVLRKWLAKLQRSNEEAYRIFMAFWQRRIVYKIDDEYEFTSGQYSFSGAMEAVINDSFIISLCIDEIWEKEGLEGG